MVNVLVFQQESFFITEIKFSQYFPLKGIRKDEHDHMMACCYAAWREEASVHADRGPRRNRNNA